MRFALQLRHDSYNHKTLEKYLEVIESLQLGELLWAS